MSAIGKKRFRVFSQELYLEESIRAIEMFGNLAGQSDLRGKIADILPQHSTATRHRVASKIIQRFFREPGSKSPCLPFLRLVANIPESSIRRDLLYWRTARTDSVISAIASEIFYPVFVLGTLPSGYDESSFRMANIAALFSTDMVITRDLVVNYARRTWNFQNIQSLTLALRIMRQAELLGAIPVTIERRRILGYYMQPHSLALEVFVYSLYEDSQTARRKVLSFDQIQSGEVAKTFLLSRLQADSLLKSAEKKGYVSFIGIRGTRHISLTYENLQTLVDSVLAERVSG